MSGAGRRGKGTGAARGVSPGRHTLQVKRVKGKGWRVCEIDGSPVSRIYARQDDAEAFRTRREQRDRQQVQVRRCLCCGNPFESEGPGNRLCACCNRKAAVLGRQFQGA